jgi:hypothetical protein
VSDCTERAGSDGSGPDHSLAPRMAQLIWGGQITQGAQTLAGLRGDDGVAAQHVEVYGRQRGRGQPRGGIVADLVALGA